EECKDQIHGYPSALFKKFYTKQHAKEYINGPIIDKNNKIEVWTDRYCKNNGKKEAIASFGVFFDDKDPRNKSERLPDKLQTNNYTEIYAVISALETSHSGIYGNDQADKLAFIGSKKDVKELIIPES
ncbi:5202_t:CDS:2, partial [Scutellospora calospora]